MSKSKIQQLEYNVSKAKASQVKVGWKPKVVRFLIICEGEKTEPNYFKSLIKNPKYSSVLKVNLEGEGKTTVPLVEKTKEIKDKKERENFLSFDRVWVVFDEDGKSDFNEAVKLAAHYRINAAWSNEAFELWYYLHFAYLDTAIDRHAYIVKLEKELRKKMHDPQFKYWKNDEHIYSILQKYGNESLAKRYAGKLRRKFHGTDYRSHKPCTRVDILVSELEHPENCKSSKTNHRNGLMI
ncbi:MAG: RloB family protein [Prevotella sp.]|jgi:hypothetical protein|nr:RloB family protein [Prevotella sp.]MCH4183309.1 RloB family protein [Prevotella sp.]MCH4242097.1 RloB family protein [Prevotella sp.]